MNLPDGVTDSHPYFNTREETFSITLDVTVDVVLDIPEKTLNTDIEAELKKQAKILITEYLETELEAHVTIK